MSNQQLAAKIADDLFTNGCDEKAERLVLELPNGRDGGGWCKQAVADRILQALNAHERVMPGKLPDWMKRK